MSEEFGSQGEAPDNKETFGTNESTTNTVVVNQALIDSKELDELRKRDENAQQHIPRLESDNAELREKIAELEAQVASSATLDDVLSRLGDKTDSSSSQPVSTDQLADAVSERLRVKAQKEVEDKNWNKVLDQLVEQHGSWANADNYITARCIEMQMDPTEATRLARQSPEAFNKLFPQPQQKPSQQSTVSASQTSINQTPSTDAQVRSKEWYAELRKKDPKTYWKVDTQAQMRRDLYSDT